MLPAFCRFPAVLVCSLTVGLLVFSGCSDGPAATVATAEGKLKGSDFGPGFTEALDRLKDVARPDSGAPATLVARARYDIQLAHLSLFVTAFLTKDSTLVDKYITIRGRDMSPDFADIKVFQLLAQDLEEGFQSVADLDAAAAIREPALAASGFVASLQGVFYRDKRNYLKSIEQARGYPWLSWMDAAMAVRDLVVETTGRPGPGMDSNWQNVVLTVLGRVCPEVSTRLIGGICSVKALTPDEPYCPAELSKQEINNRKAGAVLVATECLWARPGDGTEYRGLEAVMAYYRFSHESLLQNEYTPAPVRQWAQAQAAGMDTAEKVLLEELMTGLTQADIDAMNTEAMKGRFKAQEQGHKKAPHLPDPAKKHSHDHGQDQGEHPAEEGHGDHEGHSH